MKKKILIAMIIALSTLTACGKEEALSPIQTIEGEPISQENNGGEAGPGENIDGEDVSGTGNGEATITDRTVVDGKMQSYLTGEWKDETVVKRRNMAVMIPNNKPAMPQYGISKASIVYEAPVEGRMTRLMALFEDYDELDRIGPVRSSRDYYVYEAMAYDSIYVNWGLAVPFVAPIINTDRIDNVSQAVEGIDKAASEAFDRVSRPGYSKEFTGYLMLDGYKKAVERLGYETEYTDRFVQAFTFAADDHRAEYADYPDATTIRPGGDTNNRGGYSDAKPCFEYNETDHLYYRSQFGGPQIDEYNNEQVAVSNIVFKVCSGEVREPADKDYLAFGVHGTGDAYVFTNGKVIKGTWRRDSDYAPNLFLDEKGNEIIFNQGKTWICNIWKDYEEYISYE